MIKYNLRCSQDHGFEGWFKNSDTFDTQLAEGVLTCPTCDDKFIVKALTAPHIANNAGKGRGTVIPASNESTPALARVPATKPTAKTSVTEEITKAWVAMEKATAVLRKHVIDNCDDVGNKFAEKARKIHYGDEEQRGIYGKATPEEIEDLKEEGIDISPAPFLDDKLDG